jgi:hypothetical protein
LRRGARAGVPAAPEIHQEYFENSSRGFWEFVKKTLGIHQEDFGNSSRGFRRLFPKPSSRLEAGSTS